jgi:hypothetical protein
MLDLIIDNDNETRKGAYLRQTALVEPSCMLMRRSVRPVRDCEKKISKEKSRKIVIYFTYAWGALSQPIAVEVCTFFKVTNVINHTNFGAWLYVKGFDSAKGRI